MCWDPVGLGNQSTFGLGRVGPASKELSGSEQQEHQGQIRILGQEKWPFFNAVVNAIPEEQVALSHVNAVCFRLETSRVLRGL